MEEYSSRKPLAINISHILYFYLDGLRLTGFRKAAKISSICFYETNENPSLTGSSNISSSCIGSANFGCQVNMHSGKIFSNLIIGSDVNLLV